MITLKEMQANNGCKINSDTNTADTNQIKVVVGIATCSIAAGAKDIYEMLKDEKIKRNLDNVTVGQAGCIGVCMMEPLMEVFVPGEEKVTYVNMTPEKVEKVIEEHLINGNIVKEYTIGSFKGDAVEKAS